MVSTWKVGHDSSHQLLFTLVKKNIGVAVDKSVRLEVNDPKKKQPLEWSNAINTITKPRKKSIDSILFFRINKYKKLETIKKKWEDGYSDKWPL